MPITWPPQFPSLPPILVDTLAVNRCILEAPVAGQDAVLGLAGRLAESGQGALGLHFRLDRLDGRPMQVNVAGALNYAEEEARGVFQSGDSVFMRNWPYAWASAGPPSGGALKNQRKKTAACRGAVGH